MSGDVSPVPRGFHTVTPYMTIKRAYEAIEFYKEAFGVEEIFRWADPDGRVRHAEVMIGDSHPNELRNGRCASHISSNICLISSSEHTAAVSGSSIKA
jgi:PhnB protein